MFQFRKIFWFNTYKIECDGKKFIMVSEANRYYLYYFVQILAALTVESSFSSLIFDHLFKHKDRNNLSNNNKILPYCLRQNKATRWATGQSISSPLKWVGRSLNWLLLGLHSGMALLGPKGWCDISQSRRQLHWCNA